MDRSLAEKGWMFSTWLDPAGGHGTELRHPLPRTPHVPKPEQPLSPHLTVLAPDDVSDSDAPDLRVAEAEQEGPVRLGAQKLADVLLADEADDEPGRTDRQTVSQGGGQGAGQAIPPGPRAPTCLTSNS